MHLDLLERKSKKVRPELFLQQVRENRFNNRNCLTDRIDRYEALNDPYTSYYFANASVKQHLRSFRRAIRQQPNEIQKNRMNKLITLRIKEKFANYISPKTLIYEQELSSLQLNALAKKSSISLHKKKSRQSLASHTTDQDHIVKALKRKDRYFPPVKPEGTNLSTTVTHQLSPPHSQAFNKQPAVTDFSARATGKERESNQSETKKVENEKEGELVVSEPIENSKTSPQNSKNSQQNSRSSLQKAEKQMRMKSTFKQKDQKVFSDHLAEQLHRKKHERWVKFLQQKKVLLEKISTMDSAVPPSPAQHL